MKIDSRFNPSFSGVLLIPRNIRRKMDQKENCRFSGMRGEGVQRTPNRCTCRKPVLLDRAVLKPNPRRLITGSLPAVHDRLENGNSITVVWRRPGLGFIFMMPRVAAEKENAVSWLMDIMEPPISQPCYCFKFLLKYSWFTKKNTCMCVCVCVCVCV